jgi:DNA-directed RNA polymerase subunit RPC12/RpoP
MNKTCSKCKKEVNVLYLDKQRKEWHCTKCTDYLTKEEKKHAPK